MEGGSRAEGRILIGQERRNQFLMLRAQSGQNSGTFTKSSSEDQTTPIKAVQKAKELSAQLRPGVEQDEDQLTSCVHVQLMNVELTVQSPAFMAALSSRTVSYKARLISYRKIQTRRRRAHLAALLKRLEVVQNQ